jgi:formylglycine-generating enzyme required for sulfatase activity
MPTMPRTACRLLTLVLLPAATAGLAALPGRSAPAPLRPAHQKQFTNSVGMKLVRIPAGKFTMGSPGDEAGRRPEEAQHEVEITRPFYLGAYTVTQAEYEKVTGSNPSLFSAKGSQRGAVQGMDTSRFPVEAVSWNEAVAFCQKLSALPAERRARRAYRLPSEAEWEYACRSGAKKYSPNHYGNSLSSTQANFLGNQPYGGAAVGPKLNRPAPVGSYKPNAWGLYDMHGNVWQFCADWHDTRYYRTSPRKDPTGPAAGTARVVRGASWMNSGEWCRSAFRVGVPTTSRYDHAGFRVACDVAGPAR